MRSRPGRRFCEAVEPAPSVDLARRGISRVEAAGLEDGPTKSRSSERRASSSALREGVGWVVDEEVSWVVDEGVDSVTDEGIDSVTDEAID